MVCLAVVSWFHPDQQTTWAVFSGLYWFAGPPRSAAREYMRYKKTACDPSRTAGPRCLAINFFPNIHSYAYPTQIVKPTVLIDIDVLFGRVIKTITTWRCQENCRFKFSVYLQSFFSDHPLHPDGCLSPNVSSKIYAKRSKQSSGQYEVNITNSFRMLKNIPKLPLGRQPATLLVFSQN